MSAQKVLRNKKEMPATLSKSYLALYNGVQTAGWSYILCQTIRFLLTNRSTADIWTCCSTSVLVFQTLAVLEVLHCIIGIVPSNTVITFLQVGSRVLQVWGVLRCVEKVHSTPTLALTLIAWGLTEVVRYGFYFSNLIGKSSSFLTWCRYTLFMGLYPAGVVGEVGNILIALDTIKRRQLYSLTLPNALNISFSYYYANIFIILTYIPLFPQLFNHMLRQRRKVLGIQKNTTTAVKKLK